MRVRACVRASARVCMCVRVCMSACVRTCLRASTCVGARVRAFDVHRAGAGARRGSRRTAAASCRGGSAAGASAV